MIIFIGVDIYTKKLGRVKIKHEQLDKAIWADITSAFFKKRFSLLLVATKV